MRRRAPVPLFNSRGIFSRTLDHGYEVRPIPNSIIKKRSSRSSHRLPDYSSPKKRVRLAHEDRHVGASPHVDLLALNTALYYGQSSPKVLPSQGYAENLAKSPRESRVLRKRSRSDFLREPLPQATRKIDDVKRPSKSCLSNLFSGGPSPQDPKPVRREIDSIWYSPNYYAKPTPEASRIPPYIFRGETPNYHAKPTLEDSGIPPYIFQGENAPRRSSILVKRSSLVHRFLSKRVLKWDMRKHPSFAKLVTPDATGFLSSSIFEQGALCPNVYVAEIHLREHRLWRLEERCGPIIVRRRSHRRAITLLDILEGIYAFFQNPVSQMDSAVLAPSKDEQTVLDGVWRQRNYDISSGYMPQYAWHSMPDPSVRRVDLLQGFSRFGKISVLSVDDVSCHLSLSIQ